jgi:lysophospholipase L1-like esterase
MSPKRKHIAAVSLVVVSTLVTLVIAEILLQTFIPPKRIDDHILSYRAGPGMRDRDEQGFRNERALDHPDMIAIGDSQTEGWGSVMADAWPQALEKLTSKTVYQMALSGYGSVQYSYLFDKALQLNAETIILGLYLGNDLYDAYNIAYSVPHWEHLQEGAEIRAENGKNEIVLSKEVGIAIGSGVKIGSFNWHVLKLRIWMREHSSLYSIVDRAVKRLTRIIGTRLGITGKAERQNELKIFAQNNPDLLYIYDAEPDIQTAMSPVYRLVAVELDDWRTREGLRITERILENMRNKAAETKTSFIILIIPTKEAVYGAYLKEKGIGLPKNMQYLVEQEQNIMNHFATLCEKTGISCLNVLHPLKERLVTGQKIYPESLDGHPTAIGYATIAEAIHAHIKLPDARPLN